MNPRRQRDEHVPRTNPAASGARPAAAADPETDNTGSGIVRRAGPVILLVIAASAIVAMGAGGAGLLLPPFDLDGEWAWAVRLAGAAAAAGGLAALLAQRKRLRSTRDRRYDPAVASLVAAALIMGVLAVTSLLMPGAEFGSEPVRTATTDGEGAAAERPARNGSRSPNSGIGGGFGMGVAGSAADGPVQQAVANDTASADEAVFDWSILNRIARALLLLLLFGVVVFSVLTLTRRSGFARNERPPEVPVAAAEAEAGLEASLAEVAHVGADPRGRITAAYLRLLAVLAAAGVPREPQEAPHEHLHRALGPLGIPAEPMHRLTELYVAAQFGERPITEQHVAAAAESLDAALHSLRAVHGMRRADVGTSGEWVNA